MGVPAFFRWLSKKYPSIVVHCFEEKAKQLNGVTAPVDTSKPNPNNIEFDNLYLDMNGIIHPCCHPENKPAPKNEDEMMVAIFEYIDRIFSIVRPRKVLYMAIDGVAPRAKMNQQRSRRFRAAKEARDKAEDIERIRNGLLQQGANLPPQTEKKEHFDSNCITPGTSFMARLSKCLQFYIADRLTNDPGWTNLKVILSDANVPGEGEHKIMDYIRKQRGQPGYDPNTKHCLNGADADLIMLGLATHDPHFTILREEFKPNQKRTCDICGQVGHEREDCVGLPKEKQGEFDELSAPSEEETQFIFIRVNVLREYLERDLRMEGLPFPYNFERALDDWVFMCFFVGNDFLPHLPSLEIREGAIDRLIGLYKSCIIQAGGYLTDSGFVELRRVELILRELGKHEDEILRSRHDNEIRYQNRLKQNRARGRFSQGSQGTPLQVFGIKPLGKRKAEMNDSELPNKVAATELRKMLFTDTLDDAMASSTPPRSAAQDISSKTAREDDSQSKDDIRLHEDGWKHRYYAMKFNAGVEMEQGEFDTFRQTLAKEYVLGLAWVLQYYYQGCPSWNWYFPYHYAPFASDFVGIDCVNTNFEKGTTPFKPLQQLMAVFPAASGNFLPPTWRNLMSNPDSPILDFYPEDFKIDLNGKKYAWQGVALLPFVDEKRLLSELETVEDDLTEDEKLRNQRDSDFLFVGPGTVLRDYIVVLYEGKMLSEKQEISCQGKGISGTIVECKDPALPGVFMVSPVPGIQALPNNLSASVRYSDPWYGDDHIYKATLLEGVIQPTKVLGVDHRSRGSPHHSQRHNSFSSDRRFQSYNNQGVDRGQPGNYRPRHSSPSFNRQQFHPQGGYQQSDGYSPRGRSSMYGGDQQYHQSSQHYSQPPYGSNTQYNDRRGGGRYGNQQHQRYGSHEQQHDSSGRGRDPRRHSYPLDQHRYQPY